MLFEEIANKPGTAFFFRVGFGAQLTVLTNPIPFGKATGGTSFINAVAANGELFSVKPSDEIRLP